MRKTVPGHESVPLTTSAGRPSARGPARAVATLGMLLGWAAGAPASADAQSLFARGGLGVPIEPVDARARALGSVGVGMFGVSLTTVDPAAGFGGIPTLAVTLQPTWGTFETPEQTGDLQGQRFPILGFGYPMGARGMVSVTYGTFMDQRWAVEAPDSIDLVGQETAVLDSFESQGGISSVRLGYAHRVVPGLVLGANVGALTGQVTRTFGRAFDSTAIQIDVDAFDVEGRWRWLGPAAALGARWDVNELIRVGGSVNWYGSLEAQPQDSTEGGTVSFDLPFEYRAGTTVRLTPQLSLSGSVYFADWETTGASLAPDSLEASDLGASATTWGVGAEWGGLAVAGKSFPFRLGYRRQQFPFKFDGEVVTENALSGGLGFNLAQTEGIVLAKMDLAIERASRSAPTLSESFWRISLSFQASGL